MDVAPAASPSLPSEIVIAIFSTGAVILSSNAGEFSSGQIESLATNPRQLHPTNASLRWPPVPKTTATVFFSSSASHRQPVDQQSETVKVSGCFYLSIHELCSYLMWK